jgi:hypothetical protein
MTIRARAVFADCERALADFDASVEVNQVMRPRWVALIVLLRAVGHVLQKVDRTAATLEAQRRIDAAWAGLLNEARPHIFHDFIEAERNDTVKQYEIGPTANPKIHRAWTSNGAPLYVSHVPGAVTLSAFSMSDGPYQGHDPRQLARAAIEFWRRYLDAIDGANDSPVRPAKFQVTPRS